MTTGGFDPSKDPQNPGSYPPPQQGSYPPPSQGSYPPPQQGNYPPPSQGNYPPPSQGSYPPPQGNYPPQQGGGYPQQGGYPTPPQFDNTTNYGGSNFDGLPGGGRPGSLGIRLGARIIDGIIVGIVALILAAIFGATDNILVTGLFSGVLTFAYFVGLEVSQGATLGKKILGLQVHGPAGTPRPSLQQSAIRNAFTLLNVIPFLGGLLAFIAVIVIAVTVNSSPTKQGKHDQFAGGTQVVKK